MTSPSSGGGAACSSVMTTAFSNKRSGSASSVSLAANSVYTGSPARTSCPSFACTSSPACGSTGAPARARPAPKRCTAQPTAVVSIAETNPERAARKTARAAGAWHSNPASSARRSPPCASTIAPKRSHAAPLASSPSARSRPASTLAAAPPRNNIHAASSSESARTSSLSAGRSPRSSWQHSATSTQLPAKAPSGWLMSVSSAAVRVPARSPVSTISSARNRACSGSRKNAPEPVFTSSTSPPSPAASFLLIIEAQSRYGLSTVAVRSRSAYSVRSAGTSSAVCAAKHAPVFASTARISPSESPVRIPGIDSSLSSVPPVWPSARPLIIGLYKAAAAAIGATISEVLSPTPPVECLSTVRPRSRASKVAPENRIAPVSALTSSRRNPR